MTTSANATRRSSIVLSRDMYNYLSDFYATEMERVRASVQKHILSMAQGLSVRVDGIRAKYECSQFSAQGMYGERTERFIFDEIRTTTLYSFTSVDGDFVKKGSFKKAAIKAAEVFGISEKLMYTYLKSMATVGKGKDKTYNERFAWRLAERITYKPCF